MGFLAFMLLQYLVYPFYGIESTYSHRNRLYRFENFRMLVYIHTKKAWYTCTTPFFVIFQI